MITNFSSMTADMESWPSKLPVVRANWSRDAYVAFDGRNTNTPELKQSGQPTSGAADSSSRSNNSSMFVNTWCPSQINARLNKYTSSCTAVGERTSSSTSMELYSVCDKGSYVQPHSQCVCVGGGFKFTSTDSHFLVKICFKLQSVCKISNTSTSDPIVLYCSQ